MYITIFLAVFLASASGHLILESPKPFAFPASGHFNPLEPDGSDWPCKMPPGTTKLEFNGTGPTLMKVGESQSFSFIGAAIHGGGSGQISLLPGHDPSSKNSDFRVISTFEGGFPMANQKGNLQDGQNPTDKLEFTIPTIVPPGNYTGSVSWINRISGGTEFYMNCFAISIPGSTSAPPKDALKDLPPIFMANLGEVSKGCTTENGRAAQKAIQYPNPGTVVNHPEGTENLIKATCDGNPLATSSSGSPASDSPSTAPSSAAPAPPASSSPAPSSPASVPAPPSSTAKPSAPPSTLLTSVLAKPSSYSIAPQPSSSSSPAPTNPSGTCTEGYLLCHPDGVSFSTCTGGSFIGKTPLASGTRCTPGVGQGLTIINSV